VADRSSDQLRRSRSVDGRSTSVDHTIGIVTDSNSQIPPELIDRYAIEVVPLTVTVDGVDHAEGEDLDTDRFWERFDQATSRVATSPPSPDRIVEAYRRLAERGATEILSIHVGSAMSGTFDTARIATSASPVPVRLVDSGTASFGVACCVWEAADALAAGAGIDEAAAVAIDVAGRVGNIFVVQALDLARAGGRLAVEVEADVTAISVLSLSNGEIRPVGQAYDVQEAAVVMADYITLAGSSLKVAVGIADRQAEPLSSALEEQLARADEVRELVRYRVGPSVGAHTGPGTAGAFFYPT
jgi:DegV family protein with EDD domain